MLAVLNRHQIDEGDRQALREVVATFSRAVAPGGRLLVYYEADGAAGSPAAGAPVPASVMGLLGDVLAAASETHGELTLLADEDELTPEDAARVLGISRPLVMQRARAGRLPYRMANTHYRFRAEDVLRLKREEEPRRAALDQLGEDTDDLTGRRGP